VLPLVERTRREVRARLLSEINYWDGRHAELLDQEAAGRQLKLRPETAERRARDLERRLRKRLADLDADAQLKAKPPVIAATALVLPQGLVDRLLGRRVGAVATYARDTAAVERRAVDAVLAAERSLGRTPEEMPHQNPGFDVRSTGPDGSVHVEVKGRIAGAGEVVVTPNEVLTGKNLGDGYRLALVEVSPDGPGHDRVRYLVRPFDRTSTDDLRISRYPFDWARMWAEGGPPR
jgi:hypothetical protein